MSIFALPPVPHYGGRVPVRISKISGARKSEWVSEFQPGHWALASPKFQSVRFLFRAWLYRANAPGAGYAVGAAVSRLQAFPLGGRCPSAHTGADEGAMIERFFV